MKKSLLLALAVPVAVAVVGLAGCTTRVVVPPEGTPQNTVTSAGTGKTPVAPDMAVMSFGVTRRGPDAKALLAETSAAAEKIANAVKKEGVASEDIQTANVSLWPTMQDQNGKPVVTGYESNISVTVKVRELDKLGDIITAANQAGADSISGPSFTLSDEAEGRDAAIQKAVADARKAAESMAKAAGKSVGEVLNLSSTNVNVPVVMRGAAVDMAAPEAAAVPIEPGQLDVTANVTVVFELK